VRDVLVFYTTTEGQTRRIAERIASDLQAWGFRSSAIDLTSSDAADVDWTEVRGVLLGASLHAGQHQRAAREFARKYRDQLNAWPSAFFSVSLSAASTHPEEVAAAQRLAQAFPAEVGWQPSRVICFPGRLAYTQYGWLKRQLMRLIAQREGASTDTRHDFELTDWAAVARFATEMAGEIRNAEHRRIRLVPPRQAVDGSPARVRAAAR
jgi:menaquinone-dependent protoporphyrinogen oxidase